MVPLLITVALFARIWWLNLQAAKQLEGERDDWFSNSRTV